MSQNGKGVQVPKASESQEKVQVLRTRTFELDKFSRVTLADSLSGILWQLLDEKFTGKVSINLAQGGVASVTAEEKLPSKF